MSTKNTICWADIPVLNLKRSIKFYSAVLGVKVKTEKMPGFEFGLLPHHNQNVSGCLCITKDNRPSKKGPLIYLSVASKHHDRAEKAAVKQGGKILLKKHEIGPYGFRSVLVDSEGNRIALHSEQG